MRKDLRYNVNDIISLYKSGLTAQKIADKFLCSKGTILTLLRKNSVKTRIAARPKGTPSILKGTRNINWIGEKNPNWKGGRTPLVLKIRRCFEYKQWVNGVFKRDNYTCQSCLLRGHLEIHAHHHKIEFSDILTNNSIKTFEDAIKCKALWDIDNGITFCKQCHKKTFKFKGNQFIQVTK